MGDYKARGGFTEIKDIRGITVFKQTTAHILVGFIH